MGDLGLFGLTAPEEYGGAGLTGEDGDFTSLCIAIEELGRVDQSMRHHPGGGGRSRHQAAPDLRHRRAEGAAGCPTWSPAAPGRLRADRGRRRLGRRRPDQGRARRRRVGRQRLQAVHHQLRLDADLAGHRHRADRRRRTAKPEISAIIVPADTPGFVAEKAYDKLGWHASDTHPLSFDDARVPGGQPARRARPRLRPVPGHPGRRPGRDRRRSPSAASRPAWTWRRVRRRAHHLRRADRPQAGRGVPDRRPRR